jgi:hypothetical protein
MTGILFSLFHRLAATNLKNRPPSRPRTRIARGLLWKLKAHYLAFGESPLRLRLVHGFKDETSELVRQDVLRFYSHLKSQFQGGVLGGSLGVV